MRKVEGVPRNLINKGYQTWDEFVEKARLRTTHPGFGTEDARKERDGFCGGVSYDAALAMASRGWPEGATEIAEVLDSLPPPAEDVLPEWSLEAQGAFPAIPAFMAGDMECMWRLDDSRRPERRVTLVVPACYTAAIAADKVTQYARAVAAVVRSIEASGVSPAVYRVFFGLSPKKSAYILCGHGVREHGEPLDLGKIAFSMHPAMFRRLTFGWFDVDAEAAAAGFSSPGRGFDTELTVEVVRHCMPGIGDFVLMPQVASLAEHGLLVGSRLPELLQHVRQHVQTAISTPLA